MATSTLRLPDAHRDRLAAMAARRGLSLNKLMEELSVSMTIENCIAPGRRLGKENEMI